MAKHTLSPSNPSRRRALFGGAVAVVLGGGITAGAAASVADFVPAEVEADAALLALRPKLLAAVAEVGWSELVDEISDDKLTDVIERLIDVCWAIVQAPPAQTAAGRALKAAGAMYQLRDGFSDGCWPGDGEEMAWDVLSELAGELYVPPAMPKHIRANCEPGRVGA